MTTNYFPKNNSAAFKFLSSIRKAGKIGLAGVKLKPGMVGRLLLCGLITVSDDGVIKVTKIANMGLDGELQIKTGFYTSLRQLKAAKTVEQYQGAIGQLVEMAEERIEKVSKQEKK